MDHPIRYTCPCELLPCIEAALAANEYVVVKTAPGERDSILVVMQRGAAQVLLASCPEDSEAVIEVWGTAASVALQLLQSLPFELTLQASSGD